MVNAFTYDMTRIDTRKANINSKKKSARKEKNNTKRELKNAIHSFRVN